MNHIWLDIPLCPQILPIVFPRLCLLVIHSSYFPNVTHPNPLFGALVNIDVAVNINQETERVSKIRGKLGGRGQARGSNSSRNV